MTVSWPATMLVGFLIAPFCTAVTGDADSDGDRDFADLESLRLCWEAAGPGASFPDSCGVANFHVDNSIDLSDFAEFQNAFSPWVRVTSTSPTRGEGMVALTRETILTLSGAIDPNQAVSGGDFFATFGGAPLPVLARRITPDGRRIKMFYDPPLPASARVRVTFNGDALLDVRGYPIDADGDGIPGGIAVFDFDTCPTARIPGTVVWGHVTAGEQGPNGEELPLAGVTIRVDGFPPASGALCQPSNPLHLCAITDADGRFWLGSPPPSPGCTPEQTLDPQSACFIPNSAIPGLPVPEFFVHIDGTTVTRVAGEMPSGTCAYPDVGKPFQSVAGYRTRMEMAGTPFNIHLPCVPHEVMKDIVPGEPTVLELSPHARQALEKLFPGVDQKALDAFRMTIPVGSATMDDGTAGTTVGVFPVPTARLPAPLPPPGPIHTVDFTVQTDAPNFDIPVPICLPNLPDPTTKQIDLPGEKSALVSFNHDTGKWEGVGPMTAIDDDGDGIADRVCTDPGVGILAPGWHGNTDAFWFPLARLVFGCPECVDSRANDITDCAVAIVMGSSASKLHNQAACLIETAHEISRQVDDCFFDRNPWQCTEGTLKTIITGSRCYDALGGIGKHFFLDFLTGRWVTCFRTLRNWCRCESGESEPPSGTDEALAYASAGNEVLDTVFPGIGDAVDEYDGDARTTFDDIERILAAMEEAHDESSPGGISVTPEERETIRDLIRPRTLTIERLDNLTDYLERTTQNWFKGDFTHDQAGRTDFVDREKLARSIDKWSLAAQELIDVDPGNATLYPQVYNFMNYFADTVTDRLPYRGEYANVSYLLTNVTTGVTARGRLSHDGAFSILGSRPFSLINVSLYSHSTPAIGRVAIHAPDAGETAVFPTVVQVPIAEKEPDADNDGLTDRAEIIIGTDEADPDSDADGVPDGAEVIQDTNPLDGRPVVTGVLVSSDTPGTAVDICAFNDLAVVADSDRGVSVFDATNGQAPIAIARVDTPGTALSVTCARDRIAVADGEGGVAIIDTTDPPAARIVHTIPASAIGGSAQAVAAAGNLLFVGSANPEPNINAGNVSLVDLNTGILIQTLPIGEDIHDLAIDGSWLYALSFNTFYVFRAFELPLSVVATVSATGTPADPVNPTFPRRRFSVGGARGYIVHWRGFHLIDLTDPSEPQLIELPESGERGWKQLVPNGSGLGVGAVGLNAQSGANNDEIYLYDLGLCDGGIEDCDNREPIHTPGIARAVSLYNGLVYVADHANGLQVVNYLPFDSLRQPPQVTSFKISTDGDDLDDGAVIEDGSLLLIDLGLLDDVQVRNVELLFNGEVIEKDGNFPFQFFVDAPNISNAAAGGGLDITVRAFDTGGNVVSQTRAFVLAPDMSPPTIALTNPHDGETMFQQLLTSSGFILHFSERYEAATVSSDSVHLDWAGPNGILGDSDDEPVSANLVQVEPGRYLALRPLSTLPLGLLRVRLAGSLITDHAGNLLDGDGNGQPGGDFEMQVTVTSKPAVHWAVDADGHWHDLSKWSRPPVAADNAVINVPGDRTISLSQGTQSLSTLDCQERLQIEGGILNVLSSATLSGRVALESGRLVSAPGATVAIGGDFDWTGGQIRGGGRVEWLGDIHITGSSNKVFAFSPTVDNTRYVRWDDGMIASENAVFNNLAGATFEIVSASDLALAEDGTQAGVPDLHNFGTLRIYMGESVLTTGWDLFNHSLVHVVTGTLLLTSRGTSDGSFEIAPGATLSLDPVPGRTFDFQTPTPVTGGGLLRLVGDRINWLSGGVLDCSVEILPGVVFNTTGDVTIIGKLKWEGGNLTGAGTTRVLGDVTLQGAPSGLLDLSAGRVLETASTMTWLPLTLRGSGNSILRNLEGGIWDIKGDVLADDTASGTFTIQNKGRVIKTAGIGISTIDAPVIFDNSGELEVQKGTLKLATNSIIQLSGTTLNGGTWIVRDGAAIEIPNRSISTNAADVRLVGPSSTFSALNTLSINMGAFTISDGREFHRIFSFTNRGNLTVGAGSRLSASISFSQESVGTLNLEIRAAEEFGVVSTSGNATLAGALRIAVAPDYLPSPGDQFSILTYGSRAGTFSTVELPVLPGDLMFEMQYGATEVELFVVKP